MRVLIVVDLDNDDLAEAYGFDGPPGEQPWGTEFDDLEQSLAARLDEACYAGRRDVPVKGHLEAAAIIDDGLKHLLDCAEVGVEGADHPDDGLVSGTIAHLRQYPVGRGDQ